MCSQWRATTRVKMHLPAWSLWCGRSRRMQRSKDDLWPLYSTSLSPASCRHVQEACTRSQRLKVGGGGGSAQVEMFIRKSLRRADCCCCLLDWRRTASPLKAIGVQINSVFICFLVFQFWIMLAKMHFCLFDQCLWRPQTISEWNLSIELLTMLGHCPLNDED